MKSVLLILVILVFQPRLWAQQEIVGNVAVFKSVEHEWDYLDSTSNYTLNHFNARNHKVEIWQGEKVNKLMTDTLGTFKAVVDTTMAFLIKVYPESPIFNKEFQFSPGVYPYTLNLQISDERLAIYRDSVGDPKFHNRFSKQQAAVNFQNGEYLLLLPYLCFPSQESIEKWERIKERYAVQYEGFDLYHEKLRIAYRYNREMLKLLGIEEELW